jgi:hypothetical protein
MNIITRHIAEVLAPELTDKLGEFQHYMGLGIAGYQDVVEWHGVVPEGWAYFPQIQAKRSRVYTGRADTFAYSHHQGICKFQDYYVAAWSNGFAHEDAPGQEPHYSWSTDAESWMPNHTIVHTDPTQGVVRNLAGLYADDQYLYAFVGYTMPYAVARPGMTSIQTRSMRLDLYRTKDLENWDEYLGITDDIYLFEGPRLTREGKLLCCGIHQSNYDEAIMLIWDDPTDLTVHPRRIMVSGMAEGIRPEQGTWYQTDDGRIWMWQRDGGHLTRLALTWSDDGGKTWSPMVSTNFPNTYSRARAGRLRDGRCYIIGNNFNQYLNRCYMHIALSDDGANFDRMYTLLQGPTRRRIPGRHKENGYHYPNSIVDGDKLLVVYSVNKEDIEVAVVDTTKFK